MLHITDNSNDLSHRRRFLIAGETWFNVFANWIFSGKELLGEGFIDDNHCRRSFTITLFEGPATNEWYPHSAKIIEADSTIFGCRQIALRYLTSFDLECESYSV